jgi:hypothetical protein
VRLEVNRAENIRARIIVLNDEVLACHWMLTSEAL